MTKFESINPSTAERIAEYEVASFDEGMAIAKASAEAFRTWRATTVDVRQALLRNLAQALRAHRESLAQLMTREMGKPIMQSRSEVDKCAVGCEHYAEHGPAMLAPRPHPTEAAQSYVVSRPLGPILAIMPWNFPLWQVFRAAAPALIAGNTVLLKHAPNVTGCARAIEALFAEAGGAEGFGVLVVETEVAGRLIDQAPIAGVTLTGSDRAGRAVAARAGARLLPSLLELGGSDPYVVLADADLDRTVRACVTSRLLNSGQSCIAAKRFVVVESVHDAFVERLEAAMGEAVQGDPTQDRTTVGPMARIDLRDTLHAQVLATLEAGATRCMGGVVPERAGAWYPPTLLVDVPRTSVAAREELFGPVAAVFRARDEADAIDIANDTPYGLGAAVFTADVARGQRIAEQHLQAGFCSVNDFVRSDPRLPFGGIKQSGYGRELAIHGLRAFVNEKTVYIA
ncbi:MAG: NAD-dependent succinate-semialdehyde dehydrogenase [Myxococcota bacterium]